MFYLLPRPTHPVCLYKMSRLVENMTKKVEESDGSSTLEEDGGSLVQFASIVLVVDRHSGQGYKHSIFRARLACRRSCCFASLGRSTNQDQGKLIFICVNISKQPQWPLLIVVLGAYGSRQVFHKLLSDTIIFSAFFSCSFKWLLALLFAQVFFSKPYINTVSALFLRKGQTISYIFDYFSPQYLYLCFHFVVTLYILMSLKRDHLL